VTHANLAVALFLFSLAFFGQQWWSTLVMVLPADIFPRSAVGSVAGLTGFGGALGGLVFGLVVGQLLSHGFGYGTVFSSVAFLHLAAFLVIVILVGRIAPLAELRPRETQSS
jgi:MFS transporter, ACS family, hexuronate transporter